MISAVKGARWVMVWSNVCDQVQGVIGNGKTKLCIWLREKVKSVKNCSAQKIAKWCENMAQVARNIETKKEN